MKTYTIRGKEIKIDIDPNITKSGCMMCHGLYWHLEKLLEALNEKKEECTCEIKDHLTCEKKLCLRCFNKGKGIKEDITLGIPYCDYCEESVIRENLITEKPKLYVPKGSKHGYIPMNRQGLERMGHDMNDYEEYKEECKHDWIEYDRDTSTPIDICRNCPATKKPKSTLREAYDKEYQKAYDLAVQDVKSHLLKKIPLLKVENWTVNTMPQFSAENKAYNDAVREIEQIIQNL